MSPYLF